MRYSYPRSRPSIQLLLSAPRQRAAMADGVRPLSANVYEGTAAAPLSARGTLVFSTDHAVAVGHSSMDAIRRRIVDGGTSAEQDLERFIEPPQTTPL